MISLRNFIIFLILLDSVKANQFESESIAQAIVDVVKLTHKNENWVLDLIIFGEQTNELKDLASELLKILYKSMPMINTIIPLSLEKIVLTKSAIVLIAGENLHKFHNLTTLREKQHENLNFYIYLGGLERRLDGIREFNTQDGHVGHYEYFFVTIEENFLRVYEMIWFFYELCRRDSMLEINEINLKTRKWEKDFSLLKRKFTNFYGCPLIFGHIKNTLYFHYTRNHSGEIVHYGIIPILIDTLSKIANYSYTFVTFNASENYQNSSIKVNVDAYDVFICQSVMHKENVLIDDSIIDTIDIIIIIPPGELYTIYEKLFFPFDQTTWILLCLTFAIAFIVIFILKFVKKKFRDLFYGKEVKTPTLNVVSIFFGNSLTIIPTRNIPRLILILFIGFCLIFRTCYQSKLFEFMTSDMRKPEISTIDELFENNFLVFADALMIWFFKSIKHLLSSKVEYLYHDSNNMSDFSIMKVIENINLAHEKQAVVTSSTTHIQYEKHFETKLKVLKEPFTKTGQVLSMGINNFYSHIFYKLLRGLMPSGIPHHFVKIHKEIYFEFVNEKEDKEPKVLSMKDLDFGFFIWLPFIGLSIVVFVLELIIFKLRRKRFIKIKFAKIYPIIEEIQVQVYSNDNLVNLEIEKIEYFCEENPQEYTFKTWLH